MLSFCGFGTHVSFIDLSNLFYLHIFHQEILPSQQFKPSKIIMISYAKQKFQETDLGISKTYYRRDHVGPGSLNGRETCTVLQCNVL